MTETSNTTIGQGVVIDAALDDTLPRSYAACRKHADQALEHFSMQADLTSLRLRLVGMDPLYKCSCGRQAIWFLRKITIAEAVAR